MLNGLKTFNNKKILILVSDENSVLELSYSSEVIKDKINDFNSDFNIEEIKFKKNHYKNKLFMLENIINYAKSISLKLIFFFRFIFIDKTI